MCDLATNPKLGQLLVYITCLIQKTVIPLLFAVAMVIFIWGVVQFVINGDDAEKKEKGRTFMIWGIIGLTVMVGMWGLVAIVGNTFGLKTVIPQLPGTNTNTSTTNNTYQFEVTPQFP